MPAPGNKKGSKLNVNKETKLGTAAERLKDVKVKKVKVPKGHLERELILKGLYESFVGYTHRERLVLVSKSTGVAETSLYRRAKQKQWAINIQGQAEVDAEEMRVIAKELKEPDKVSLETISNQMKDFASMSLTSAEVVVRHNSRMMYFYATKLEQIVEKAGGLDSLNMYWSQMFNHYEELFHKYQKSLLPFIAPDKLARMLKPLGLEDMGIVTDEIEAGALTPKSLQEKLLKLGMMHNVEDVEVEDLIAVELGELPDVDGTKMITKPLAKEVAEDKIDKPDNTLDNGPQSKAG